MSTEKKPTQVQTQQISSFQSPYVSLDVVSYMKSGQIMPFHIFNHSVMPNFLRQLSHGRGHFHCCNRGCADEEDAAALEAAAGASGTASDPHDQLVEEIKEDVAHIWNASRRLENWESEVNGAINELVLQCLDDGYRESAESGSLDAIDTAFRMMKLLRTRKYVSMLKEKIYLPLKFASDNNSESFKRSNLSLERLRSGDRDATEETNHLHDMNTSGREIDERKVAEIRRVYDGLAEEAKQCLLCFSVFPENEVIKKKVLAHWWVGEGFVSDDEDSVGGENVITVSGLFSEFASKRLIENVYKKQMPSTDSYKMDPCVRYALIELAEREGFAEFDEQRTRPTAIFSEPHRPSCRPCLARISGEEPGASAREFTSSYSSKQENVRTLFNVSEVQLEFESRWFSKMKKAKVLQLGKWQSSAEHIVEVDSSDFLKGLKRMKDLRYLSLRGISRITELPSSVCKLSSLRILNLNGCRDLLRLPEGIGSLKKLAHLDMNECYFISHMPKGISQLSELKTLKGFVIGKTRPEFEGQQCQLEDLTKLKKLSKLNIHVDRNLDNAKRELSCLDKFENLESLFVSWSRIYYSSRGLNGMRRVITQVKRIASFPGSPARERSPAASLKASPNKLPEKLKKLDLHYFPSKNISQWFSLEKMQGLKKLYIRGGDSLSDLSEKQSCWRTVEILRLKFLKELAMEWKELRDIFPEMVYLEIDDCPKLSSFPVDDNGIWKA